jgi:hypothetical protein
MTEKKKQKQGLIGSWRLSYAFVLAFLVVQIIFFYLFTRWFS